MPVSTYAGTLNFKVGRKKETAEVTIQCITRDAAADGGWECIVTVEYGGQKYTDSFFAKIIDTAMLRRNVQSSLASMPAPLKDINVRTAGFTPKFRRSQ